MRRERADMKYKRANLRPGRTNFRLERADADFRPERARGGWID